MMSRARIADFFSLAHNITTIGYTLSTTVLFPHLFSAIMKILLPGVTNCIKSDLSRVLLRVSDKLYKYTVSQN